MSEYFQYLGKPDRVEDYLETFLDAVEEKIPERAKINAADADYQKLALKILREGTSVMDRTGTGTIKSFPESLQFDLSKGEFPLLTTKRIYTKPLFSELIWFINGDTNVRWLQERGVKIWDEWADENGELGPIYGSQWRNWRTVDGESVDQLSHVIENIKSNPYSRRHIVSAWNAGEIDKMALPPCHMLYQFDVTPNKNGGKDYLNLQLDQRSADLFLGVPFNIASYAALQSMVAQITDTTPGKLTVVFGDTHIYTNHVRQFLVQLSRDPYPPPQLELNPEIRDIDDFKVEDLHVKNYHHWPSIKAPISV